MTREDLPEHHVLKKAVHKVRALPHREHSADLRFQRRILAPLWDPNFNEVGTVMVNVINRDYCKKVLVQLTSSIRCTTTS